MKALTIEEINRLLSSIKDVRLRGMVLFGFRHGARASEICGLKRTDLHLDAGLVTVRRLKGSLTTCQPLGTDEKELLALTLRSAPASLYVFCRPTGRPFTRYQFYRMLQKACIAAGIPSDKAHPHALKHGLGRALVAANVNMAVVKQALGHRSINSTAVYTELDDETTGGIVQSALGVNHAN